MLCSKCKVKKAHIAIIDDDGVFYDDMVFCCWCAAKEINEKLAESRKNKEKVTLN